MINKLFNYKYLKNMASKIKDVIVDKISLVSRDKTPAVQKATFRLFKFFKGKTKLNKDQKNRLEKLQSNFTNLSN